jgi:peptidoglycan-associated lipoprotein
MRLILVLCVLGMLFPLTCPSLLPAQSHLVRIPDTDDGHTPETSVRVTTAASYSESTARSMLDWLIFRYETIPFDFASYQLSPEARNILARKARWIKGQAPTMQLEVVGHCDRRGSEAYNMKLGALRADAVKQFLVGCGVARQRVHIVSAGEKEPLIEGDGEKIWAVNRRAEVMKP